MTTLADLVTETQRRVLSSMREETDHLGSNVSAGTTTLSLASGESTGSIAANAILQIDYELFLVGDNPTASNIPVTPGYLGSTQASHTAGTPIVVNPRFPAVDIIKAVNETIDSLSSPSNGMFQPAEITLTYNPVVVGYDFTDANTNIAVASTDLIDLIEIRSHDYGPFQVWPQIPLSLVQIQRQADTTVFPSGMALEIKGGPRFPGRPIRVQYKKRYTTPLVNASDDVLSVTGLQTTAHDIPVLGATARLMEFREIPRSFMEAQPQPRRAQEVPVGSSLTAMKGVMQRLQFRIDEERARLDRQYKVSWR
jgi:hypothetical protein